MISPADRPASTTVPTAPAAALLTPAQVAAEFDAEPGYLAAATCGLPPRGTVAAVRADLDRWAAGRPDLDGYEAAVAAGREHYAALVGVRPDQVAIGSQTSALVSLVAAALPDGAEVLVAEGDFTSLLLPFTVGDRLRVRTAPLSDLAAHVRPETALVAVSLVQSATGQVLDLTALLAATAAHGTLTCLDTTQAAGVHPVDAGAVDLTVCHSYKWLCAPRGVAFLTVGDRLAGRVPPLAAGWYAGREPMASCYGTRIDPAPGARALDVSPAWQAWVGAEPALRLFADADVPALWAHTSGLGDLLCDGLGLPRQHQAIVSWPDPEGSALTALTAAGLRASGRAGRVRAAFHVWNTKDDVTAALAALGAPRG